jgi:hypothetical protein
MAKPAPEHGRQARDRVAAAEGAQNYAGGVEAFDAAGEATPGQVLMVLELGFGFWSANVD